MSEMESQDRWVDIDQDGLPDFRVHGFHTGRKVRIRLQDGSEHETIYQGWGEFGFGQINRFFQGVTHWQAVDAPALTAPAECGITTVD